MIPTASRNSTEALLSLQYARAIAALLVVFAHLSGFELFRQLGFHEFGGMGVDIFFVISGFIITQASANQGPIKFALRRLIRIAPAYWTYTLLLAAVAVLVPALAPRVVIDVRQLLCSLFFIPYFNQRGEANPILLQGWSLNFEIFFYVIFFVALFFKSRAIQLGFVGIAIIVLVLFGLSFPFASAPMQAYTSAVMLEFLLGVGLSLAMRARDYSPALYTLALVMGAATLVIAELATAISVPRAFALGPAAALFLFGLIGLETTWRRRPVTGLRRLGDASYSLYLSHSFVLSALALIFHWVDASGKQRAPTTEALAFMLLALICSALVAFASFSIIERPSASWLNGIVRRISKSKRETLLKARHENTLGG